VAGKRAFGTRDKPHIISGSTGSPINPTPGELSRSAREKKNDNRTK